MSGWSASAASSQSRRAYAAVIARRSATLSLPGVVRRTALADDRDLDLARVLDLLLHVAGDLVAEQRGAVVVDVVGPHDHADLPPGVHRIDLLDAVVALGDRLELVKPLDVLLERLAAGARAGAGQGVHDLHDHRLDGLQLHLVVVRLHGVGHGLALLVAPGQLAADERVGPFDLVRDGLADVVQQRSAGSRARAGAELLGQHAGQPRALDRMVEHVLAIARAVSEPAEQLRELGVKRADVRFEHRLLAHLDDVLVDLGLGLVIGLLDPGRVDATVLQQPLEGEPSDLAAYPVEAGEQHRARGVVDDEVDAGEGLERADVAALAADDAALQLVGAQLDHGHGRLHRVTARHSLHDRGEDAARPAVGVALRLLLDLADEARALVAQLVLELPHQDLLGLARGEAGHALELPQLLPLGRLQLLRVPLEVAGTVRDRALPGLELLHAAVDRGFLGADALLEPRQLLPPGAELGVDVLAPLGAALGLRMDGRLRGRPATVGSGRSASAALGDEHRHDGHDRRNQRRQHDLHRVSPPSGAGRRSLHRLPKRCGYVAARHQMTFRRGARSERRARGWG